MKILVVDDERAIRNSLKEILTDEGYEVDTAEDGAAALALAEREHYNIIFCDIKMPGMDGIEFLDKVMEAGLEGAVVMISGHGDIDTAVECIKKGAFDFIQKPLDLNRILITIKNATDKVSLVKETKILKKKVYGQRMVGESEAICNIKDMITKVAATDARVLMELHQLYGKIGRGVKERFEFLDAHRETAFRRDDLIVEYCALLNDLGRHREALDLILAHTFHPWEGGEGRVTGQYAAALTRLGVEALDRGDFAGAKELFEKALVFPYNLGEGKLEGARDNDIHYYLGLAERALGHDDESLRHLELAAAGDEEPASALYYNDQPADMIFYQGLASRALGREERARSRFHRLVSYGEKHYYDQVRIDYFAVSLPDLQLFDDDLSLRSRAHCEYLIALGSWGLGDRERAERCFSAVLQIDPCHQGAILHERLLRSGPAAVK